MIKYLNYIIKNNIYQLIYQLITKIRKTKIILEYNYQFRKKANRIISLKFIIDLFENLRNFSNFFISFVSSIFIAKNKKKYPKKKLL